MLLLSNGIWITHVSAIYIHILVNGMLKHIKEIHGAKRSFMPSNETRVNANLESIILWLIITFYKVVLTILLEGIITLPWCLLFYIYPPWNSSKYLEYNQKSIWYAGTPTREIDVQTEKKTRKYLLMEMCHRSRTRTCIRHVFCRSLYVVLSIKYSTMICFHLLHRFSHTLRSRINVNISLKVPVIKKSWM